MSGVVMAKDHQRVTLTAVDVVEEISNGVEKILTGVERILTEVAEISTEAVGILTEAAEILTVVVAIPTEAEEIRTEAEETTTEAEETLTGEAATPTEVGATLIEVVVATPVTTDLQDEISTIGVNATGAKKIVRCHETSTEMTSLEKAAALGEAKVRFYFFTITLAVFSGTCEIVLRLLHVKLSS